MLSGPGPVSAMLSARCHAIGTLGLSERELCVIKSICAISISRPLVYQIVDPQGAQIQLVNADDPQAMTAAWAIDPDGSLPTVYLSGDGRPLGLYWLKRPVHPAALLKVLDQVSAAIVQRAAYAAESASRFLESMPTLPPTFHALVVDESPAVRQQLEWVLSDLGGDADSVESGEQALAMLQNGGYDMVFLDVVLPGADGYQICKTIKRNPRHKDLAVVMLTRRASHFDKVRGTLAGCDTYLTKPAEMGDLQRVVERYAPQRVGSTTT